MGFETMAGFLADRQINNLALRMIKSYFLIAPEYPTAQDGFVADGDESGNGNGRLLFAGAVCFF